jgi:hypothetical protein
VQAGDTWTVSGTLQNDSDRSFDDVGLVVELKDSRGNVITRETAANIIGGRGVQAQAAGKFSMRISNNQPAITQATAYFENGAKERLSEPVALMLIVKLDTR